MVNICIKVRCRYNRKVLILDRSRGRTQHAKHIENFLSHTSILGRKIMEEGLNQARNFGAESQEATASKVLKNCEVIMSNFGYRLNDEFLSELSLKKDRYEFKYVTGDTFESSLTGLYILGPLTGEDQIVIAAGEGAVAAIDINKRLLEIHAGE